jgi:hypothetical protein
VFIGIFSFVAESIAIFGTESRFSVSFSPSSFSAGYNESNNSRLDLSKLVVGGGAVTVVVVLSVVVVLVAVVVAFAGLVVEVEEEALFFRALIAEVLFEAEPVVSGVRKF